MSRTYRGIPITVVPSGKAMGAGSVRKKPYTGARIPGDVALLRQNGSRRMDADITHNHMLEVPLSHTVDSNGNRMWSI